MRLIFFYRTFWYVYSICIRNSNIEIFTTSWRICGKYSYAYKLRVTSETLITYRINILRNSDVFQAKATPVFVNCFILEIYTLNGRKVMVCILKKLKKEKI